MNTHATKEEEAEWTEIKTRITVGVRIHSQERYPCAILNESGENVTVAKTIFKKGVADIAGTGEYHCASKPDFETVHVVAVDLKSEPKEKIIENREKGGGGNTIVREHVRHHGHFVMNGSA
jgi:hypothetical protein